MLIRKSSKESTSQGPQSVLDIGGSMQRQWIKEKTDGWISDWSCRFDFSSAIYHFKCQFNVRYGIKTGQRLEAVITQHVRANIHKEKVDNLYRCVDVTDSAIDGYMNKNQQCAPIYSPNMIEMLSRAYSDYILNVSGSVYIKSHQPTLSAEAVVGILKAN